MTPSRTVDIKSSQTPAQKTACTHLILMMLANDGPTFSTFKYQGTSSASVLGLGTTYKRQCLETSLGNKTS